MTKLTRFFENAARRRAAIMFAGAVAVAVALMPMLRANDDQTDDDMLSVVSADAPIAGAVFGGGPALRPGERICTTPAQPGPDVDTGCEKLGPSNETSIAVDPANVNHMIGGANDYQLGVDPGGHVTETILSRAHVTFDGGKTWSEYPIFSDSAYQSTGDPAVAFDADGHAYYATLGWRFVGQGNSLCSDVLVANSADGGKTWTSVRVADGSGNQRSFGDALDKEYIAAWGHGNVILTFGDYRATPKEFSARIYSSVSHDAGRTWSVPVVVSGSLDGAYFATPAVAADGRIYVAFVNVTASGDEYAVVEVDPQTGAQVAGPFTVATVNDGAPDRSAAFFRQIYQDAVFRAGVLGNITTDPKNAAHLAVIWPDMRNSPTPLPPNLDPYSSITNSDVIVSQSFDSGRTWSTPSALPLSGDQFMPWGSYDANGVLRIGFFDRQYDATNHKYGYTLATETAPGALTFTTSQLTTTLSDPTTGSRWFAVTLNQLFPFATRFIGDYSTIAAIPGGGIVAYWTDLRNQACFLSRCGHGEDAYFRRAP